ncbi:ABC transporter ATP-binding protein [Actinobacteria bacterium YIM 96077]|uniref:ABC transporter n=1 Tax=Phytoactinopolyspora halophila TaxID=1981511 RepID=A0A329QF86_9ACTN|nr:ABC transporter ATP-binding protein [Phytoactinopolyspora halophila]AYY14057.1 ABC transporter ATP-binding protein [Actinobacteria bacterium YIM 96077]RAW10964.1 ABC transporter [Phytoactinopolyspora halophila]
MNAPVVEARHLTVELGERPVLHEVDFHVNEGEVVTLLGANGSGKSTLVRAVAGLVPVTSGEITLFGQPQRSFRAWKRIGYVPQRLTATGGVPATVREVVSSGRLAHRRPFLPASRADRDAVEWAIDLVGLSDRINDGIQTLSGGQQQRVLIARAAAGTPDLLVLDEPNAGLDWRSQEAFARSLRTFVASGRTVLVVLHDMGPLAPLVDRGVVLDAGRVTHDGPLPVPAGAAGMPDDHRHTTGEQTGPFGWIS